MLSRKLTHLLIALSFVLGLFPITPAHAANFGIRFGYSIDSKDFANTKTARVFVDVQAMDPINDPVISLSCGNGGQAVGLNQCAWFNVPNNITIQAYATGRISGTQIFRYDMCELDRVAPSFLPSASATDQAGSTSGAWTNKTAPVFSWTGLADPPTACSNGDLNGYRSGIQGYKVYFGNNANGGGGAGDTTTVVTTPALTPPVLTQSGTYYLRAQAFDQMNNYGTWQTLYTYKLDTLTPNVSLSPQILPDGQNGWYSKTVPGLMLNVMDLYNNIATKQWRVNGGPWGDGTQIDLSGDGIYTIEVQVIDQAGNRGLGSAVLKIDRNPIPFMMVLPAITKPVFKFPTWYTADVTLLDKTAIGKQVTDVSGIQAIQFKKNDGSWTVVAPTFTQSGIYHVDVQTQDVAGNMDSGTVTIQLDKDQPVMKATLDTPNAVSAKTARLLVAASDLVSGVGVVSYQIDTMGVHPITTVNTQGDFIQDIDLSGITPGPHMINVQVMDVAGNVATQAFNVSTASYPIFLPVVVR